MSTMTVESPPSTTISASAEVRGGVQVRGRVIDKVVREASADALAAPRRDVSVEVSEGGGDLIVRISTKLVVPDLDDAEAVRSELPVVERLRQVQTGLAAELARLTGRNIRRVSVTVTGATVPPRKRVR